MSPEAPARLRLVLLAFPEQAEPAPLAQRLNAYVQEHVHKVQEQVYYVLEGEGVLTVGKDRHLMRPHDYVYLPPGVPHSFTNTGNAGLVFLVITTPADDEPLIKGGSKT